MTNSMTPSGIEPATFRFVVQHLNHCATAVPTNVNVQNIFHERNNITSAQATCQYLWTCLLRHVAKFVNLPSEKAYCGTNLSGATDMRHVKAVQWDTTESCTVGHN